MDSVYSGISNVFEYIVQYSILLAELIGVAVLLYTIVRAVVMIFKKEPRIRLELAEGIALSLEFKMGGELLRTVLVREWNELIMLGSIILLRAAMAFLIQWEIKTEKKNRVSGNTENGDVSDPPAGK